MKDTCAVDKQMRETVNVTEASYYDRRALTCLTIFTIGMEIVTATRSTETYDSKQKSEEDDER